MNNNHHYMDVSNLNAPYDNMSLQGVDGTLGGGDSLGFNMEEEHNVPWMEASPQALAAQKDINVSLAKDGYQTVTEDGVLGPKTCGALSMYNKLGAVWGACDAHVSEFVTPGKKLWSVPMRETNANNMMVPPEKSSVPTWVWAMLVGTGAVGVAIYLKKRKSR